ncbi:MAG: hypothetical protein L3J47_00250 [Sulfurovum sp.]|nr:hypothetical protein [Sulfurovum sp.]
MEESKEEIERLIELRQEEISELHQGEMTDLGDSIDAKLSSMSPGEKDQQLYIMYLLNSFESFTEFVEKTYDIITSVDHDLKEVNVAVIEKPVEAPEIEAPPATFELDSAMMIKATLYLKGKGVTDTSSIISKLASIFGGVEENALVTSATDADIQKELSNARLAKDLLS